MSTSVRELCLRDVRRVSAGLACAAALGVALAAVPAAVAPAGRCEPVAGADAGSAASALPVLRERSYRMAGRVRLLLFWVRRDPVGSGRIVWRGDAGGNVGHELLIGTDPALAPRHVNRWGYIAEDRRDGETRVLGVMSTSEEKNLSDITNASGAARGRFKALHATVAASAICTRASTVETERDLTLHDAPALLDRVRGQMTGAGGVERTIEPGVRPGFLSTVAGLVDEVVAADPGQSRRLAGRSARYIHNQKVLELVLEQVRPLPGAGGGTAPVRAEFAIRIGGRTRESFELEFPTRGPDAGVPTIIRYQPRWWLQAELILERGDLPGQAPAGGQLADVQQVQHRDAAARKAGEQAAPQRARR